MNAKDRIFWKFERAIRHALDNEQTELYVNIEKEDSNLLSFIGTFIDSHPALRGNVTVWVTDQPAYYRIRIVGTLVECETCGNYLCSDLQK
jgi:hypothetical protein